MSVVILSSQRTVDLRHQFRPYFVEPGEWFGTVPEGDYDVAAFLKTLPPQFHNPQLIIVIFQFNESTRPRNLAALNCPKVLLISDTHHQVRPISTAIPYALAEPYDLVVGQYVRQHLHFFREAGLSQTVWIPCFTLNPYEFPPQQSERGLCDVLFVGQTNRHPYRRHVLAEITQRGILHGVGSLEPDLAAREYNRTRINLNISLNGDLNLRTFEVLAASGFLLTDRLSPESGLDLLFHDRRHLVQFDSAEHLSELIQYYLAHPQEAHAIAAQGHAHYLQHHTPARRIEQLYDALAGKIAPEYALDLDPRTRLAHEPLPRLLERVKLYECIQQAHCHNPSLSLLFWRGAEREALDAMDLPRAKISLLTDHPSSLVEALGLRSRIEVISPQHMAGRNWGMLIAPPSALQDPLFHAAIRQRIASYIWLPHVDRDQHQSALQQFIQLHALNQYEPSIPPLLSLSGIPFCFE